MTKIAYISTINFSTYSASNPGSGTIGLHHGNSYTNISLDEEDVSKLKELAAEIINKHKMKFAQAIASIDVTPQLTYDASKTIDNDEYPF